MLQLRIRCGSTGDQKKEFDRARRAARRHQEEGEAKEGEVAHG
jgi:hypothetical protein